MTDAAALGSRLCVIFEVRFGYLVAGGRITKRVG